MHVAFMGNRLMKFIDQKRDMEISFGILCSEWEGNSGEMKTILNSVTFHKHSGVKTKFQRKVLHHTLYCIYKYITLYCILQCSKKNCHGFSFCICCDVSMMIHNTCYCQFFGFVFNLKLTQYRYNLAKMLDYMEACWCVLTRRLQTCTVYNVELSK